MKAKGTPIQGEDEEIKALVAAGYTKQQLEKYYGTTTHYVTKKLKEIGVIKSEKIPRKCKICQYRSTTPKKNGCDYILITGERRKCPADHCTVYKKGPRLPDNGPLFTGTWKRRREEGTDIDKCILECGCGGGEKGIEYIVEKEEKE